MASVAPDIKSTRICKSISDLKPLYVFRSHEHQDHFDKETLKMLNPHIHDSCKLY